MTLALQPSEIKPISLTAPQVANLPYQFREILLCHGLRLSPFLKQSHQVQQSAFANANKYYKEALGAHAQWTMLSEKIQIYTDLGPSVYKGLPW